MSHAALAAAPETAPEAAVASRLELIPLEQICRNPDQPRKTMDPGKLLELAASIRNVGLLQPIVVLRQVVPIQDPDDPARERLFQIVAGERRFHAYSLNHREHKGPAAIEARVFQGVTAARAHEIALIENLDREQLNALEEAGALRDLKEKHGYTQDRLAEVSHRSRPRLANLLRLLELPEPVQDFLRAGKLLAGHGEALLRFKEWPEVCNALAAVAIAKKATQAELEKPMPFAAELERANAIVRVDYADFEETGLDFDDQKTCNQLKALPFVRIVKGADNYENDTVYALDPAAWEKWIDAKREAFATRTNKKFQEKQAELDLAVQETTAAAAPSLEAFAEGVSDRDFKKALAAATLELCQQLLAQPDADLHLAGKRSQWLDARIKKLEKEAAKAAKKKAAPVKLADLGYGNYKYLDEIPAAIRKKIPPEVVEIGVAEWTTEHHAGGDLVEFTRETGLVQGLLNAATAKKNKGVRAKLDAAFECVLENVAAIKSVTSEDLAVLVGWSIKGYPGRLQPEDFEALKLEPAKDITKLEPVDLVRLTLIHNLRTDFEEYRKNARDLSGNLASYAKGYEKRLAQKQRELEAAKAAKAAKKNGTAEIPETMQATLRKAIQGAPNEAPAYWSKMYGVPVKWVNAVKRQVALELEQSTVNAEVKKIKRRAAAAKKGKAKKK